MKKSIITIILLISCSLAIAQQKYVAFTINGLHGITDTLGNEAVKPTYGFLNRIEAKSQIYLQNFSERSDAIFDTKTGTMQHYESLFNDEVRIKDVPYSLIFNKGKRFLLSEETTKTINLTYDYSDFKNHGQYIMVRYYPKIVVSKSAQKDKNGKLLPPKIEPPRQLKFVVLSNDETLKPILKGEFDNYLLLYNVAKEDDIKDADGSIVVHLVERIHKTPDFNFIVFSNGNSHTLYNGKMGLVKKFILAKADEEMLLNACEKIVKNDLGTSYSGADGGLIAISDPSSRAKNVDDGYPNEINDGPAFETTEKEKEKLFIPFFYIKKLANGNTLFAMQETRQISNHIFEANPETSIDLDTDKYTITIRTDGKEDSKFSFNPKTGVIYLPQQYIAQLGLTMI